MGYHTPDAYYQPEAFGLTIVEVEDDPSCGYNFNTFVIWKHQDGRVFYATDAGCSCYSQFEWATTLEDLELLSNWEDFEQEVTVWADAAGFGANGYPEGKHALLMAGAGALA